MGLHRSQGTDLLASAPFDRASPFTGNGTSNRFLRSAQRASRRADHGNVDGVIQDYWLNALYSLIPTVVIALIFWMVLRSIIRADRTERKVYAQIEAEERTRLGLPAETKATATSTEPHAGAPL